jgi:pimeloyl-[acyl-carrier protein] methyl ester esterase
MTRFVLLPGLDGSGDLFARLIALAPQCHHLTTVRYPNNLTQLAELAAFAKAHIDDGEAPVVIAESFSGAVLCQLLRAQVPMKAAIFVASFSQPPRPNLIRLASLMPEIMSRAFTPTAIQVACLNGTNDQALSEAVNQVVKQIPHATIAGRLQALLQLQKNTITTNTPILALQATHDRLLDRSAMQSLSKKFSAINVVEIKGPHFLLQVAPDACWQAISQFIKRSA